MHALEVGVPAPIGLLLRPGDIVAESGPLAAYVAYRSHWNPLPNLSRYRSAARTWATGKEYLTRLGTGQSLRLLITCWRGARGRDDSRRIAPFALRERVIACLATKAT